MGTEVDVQVLVFGESQPEPGFRLPVEATPGELLPYLLRDLGLPSVVDHRRCFYRLRLRSAGNSFFRTPGEWNSLYPDVPLDQQFVPDKNRWDLEITELHGAGVHEAEGSIGGALPKESDPRTLRVSGKRQRRKGRGGSIDLDAPQGRPAAAAVTAPRGPQPPAPKPEVPSQRGRPEAQPLPTDTPQPKRDDTRPARVITVTVTRPSDDMFAPRREDLQLNLTGDQLAELLAAQYALSPPPRGDLSYRAEGGDWQPLPGGEMLGHLGFDDGFEVRIGPERAAPPEVVYAGSTETSDGAREARGGPNIPPEPPAPPAASSGPPIWVWVLLFLFILVLGLGGLYLLRAARTPDPGTGANSLPGGPTVVGSQDQGGGAGGGLVTPAGTGPEAQTISDQTGSGPTGSGSAGGGGQAGGVSSTVVNPNDVRNLRLDVPRGLDPVPPAPNCRAEGQKTPCHMRFAFDGLHDTAWCFKDSEVGKATATLPLPPDTGTLLGFSVLNGYQKRDESAGGKDRWLQNHRVKTVTIQGVTYTVADERAQQFIALEAPVTAQVLVVSVTSIYRGTGGQSADVCVSELQLGAAR